MSDRSTEATGIDRVALAAGTVLIALAVSSLLDDSTAVPHPWWIVPVAAVLAGCVAVVVATARRLLVADDDGQA